MVKEEKIGPGSKITDALSLLLAYPDFARPWIPYATAAGVRAVREKGIDWILATGMPWSSLIVGDLIKRITGARLIVDFRDPWVGNPYIAKSGAALFLDQWLERRIVRNADICIANTQRLHREMSDRYPDCRSRIMVLPNGFDPSDFENLPRFSFPADALTVSHAGFLYLKRDPISVLEAIRTLRSRYEDGTGKVHFHHVGNIQLSYDLPSYCRENRLEPYVHLPGPMPHRDCLGYLQSSDALLLIQPGTRTQIPSKIYEYICLDKPIIAVTEKEGALGELVSRYGFGRVFEPGDVEGIALHLHELAERKKNEGTLMAAYPNKDLFDARLIVQKLAERMKA